MCLCAVATDMNMLCSTCICHAIFVQVSFLGEVMKRMVVDQRENFGDRLLSLSLCGTYFEGSDDNMILRHNTVALQVFLFHSKFLCHVLGTVRTACPPFACLAVAFS